MTKAKKAKARTPRRPKPFDRAYIRQAYIAASRLGSIDKDLAALFNASVSVLQRWKNRHPQFKRAIEQGREVYDSNVELSLLKRAKGYDYEEKTYEGEKLVKRVTKHVSPDTTACIFWLKNRHPGEWKDVQDVNLGGQPANPVIVDFAKVMAVGAKKEAVA